MTPYYEEEGITIYHGDNREIMRQMEPDSIDSVVCDPPYGLSFMGKGWDYAVPGPRCWAEAWRVLKPGGHLLAFGGTRLYHRLTCAIEDSGFEIRDCLSWLYGSGFPKSHDVSIGIDKQIGGLKHRGKAHYSYGHGTDFEDRDLAKSEVMPDHQPLTTEAAKWKGYGTALKPAWEPIIMARKPFKGTVAGNVLKHGTGGINVDGCRIETDEGGLVRPPIQCKNSTSFGKGLGVGIQTEPSGRWPANLVHDGSEEVLAGFPETGESSGGKNTNGHDGAIRMGRTSGQGTNAGGLGDSGSAARFFYCAKASKKDRGEGNTHATVKPVKLMQWLCRMVTPKGGVLLDPFAGSFSTIVAAQKEGFRSIGIDLEEEYCKIGISRLKQGVLDLF